jgi:DNA-binding GntR family transcriptional regulator
MSITALSPGKQFTPKYVDLARDLMREISGRSLEIGDRLGTEQELSERYSLSRVTVRQALELLENEGYVSRKRALGTFVAKEVKSMEQLGRGFCFLHSPPVDRAIASATEFFRPDFKCRPKPAGR